MSQPNNTDFPVLDAIQKRWSPRSFSEQSVDTKTLATLFEAARWGASAFNEQPWRFILARKADGTAFQQLLSCLVEPNQKWAQHAPVLALCVASSQYALNGKDNSHAWHDLGLACGQLSLQAAEMGLVTHFMAGILPARAIELYQIPEGFKPVTGLAIGYLGEEDFGERTRKPLNELVFADAWGTPYPLSQQ